jgi:RNA polymerase sigma-70 factor (ECF subfamily)
MDVGLVIRAQHGDEAAFAALTAASAGRLHRVALRILREPGLAEDATQQALIAIWRKLPRLKDPARFEAWSYRFVVNACSDEARRARRSLPEINAYQEPISADHAGIVGDRDLLERGFKRLSVDHRAVIVLHHYMDLTIEDTAEALGISVGTTKSRLHRAMAKLRIALGADGTRDVRASQGAVR